ncbi:hypothetical protein BH11PSE4_BH11PSE4_44450 [soil metagenome]
MDEQQTDAITPSTIEHKVEEIWHDGQLQQYYNFLDYHFECDGAYFRARSYADNFREVALFGPFEGKTSIREVQRPDFERDVLSYLERRFLKVSQR